MLRAVAITNRCFCPPDSDIGCLSASFPNPSCSRCWASASCATVSANNCRCTSCITRKAVPFFIGSLIDAPSSAARTKRMPFFGVPLSIFCRLQSTRASVVLPAPLGPTRPVTWPAGNTTPDISRTRLPWNDTTAESMCSPGTSPGSCSGTVSSGALKQRSPRSRRRASLSWKNSSPVNSWAILPSSTRITRSTMPARKYTRCSAITRVLPCSLSLRSRAVKSSMDSGSRLEVGSSNNRMGVSCA